MITTPRPDYDVVLAGSGVAGALLAHKLSQAGLRVLILEAGDRLYFDRETGTDQRQPLLDAFADATARVPNAPYPNLDQAPQAIETDPGRYYYGSAYQADAPAPRPEAPAGGVYRPFRSTSTRIAGGTTYHWLGTSLRYTPATFRERTLYGHAIDWPFAYDDLEDFYWRAEQEIGVAGDDREELGAPRHGKPYPMPPILPSYGDRVMAERLQGLTFEGLPVQVAITPQGRNSIPYQDRPPCAGSTNCIPICPIQAKWDATVPLKRAINPALDPADRPGSVAAELRLRSVVHHLEFADDGAVAALVYLAYDGLTYQERRVTARRYVLAAHAIETTKILLLSAADRPGLERGAANASDMVGRHLMDHCIRIAHGMADVPLYPFRGPLSTSGIESLRDGAFRRHRACFRVEIEAIGANWALNSPYGALKDKLLEGLVGERLRRAVAWDVTRQVQIDALIEPRPDFDSRVTLARDNRGKYVTDKLGVPRPRLDFVLDRYTVAGGEAFARLADLIIERMSGGRQRRATLVDGWFGAGHIMGTFRMGDDPATSVTDGFGTTWQHPNLVLTGSGLFPTVDAANPTLTIAAVTLRQAERLIADLSP